MTSESLARYHERKQDHADGFQAGWHAALQRVSEGDSVTKLRDSVPDTAPAYRAERDRLAAMTKNIRHCADCGGDWYDGGLNAPECPHCRITRLAAKVERLTVAARDFLDHHSLDCGAHYCRYCPARSPEWNHESYCAYVRSQSTYTALSAALAEEGQ